MFQNSINQNQYFILLCLTLRLHLAMVIMAFCADYYIEIFLLEVGRCKLQVKCPMLQAAASVDGLIDWETFLELDPDRAVDGKLGKTNFKDILRTRQNIRSRPFPAFDREGELISVIMFDDLYDNEENLG